MKFAGVSVQLHHAPRIRRLLCTFFDERDTRPHTDSAAGFDRHGSRPSPDRGRLGAGGMGEVWRAEDPKLQRTVAVKRVSVRETGDPEEAARLLREGQRLSALNHPNIASVYDVLEQDDEIFLVMEYVEGQTLRQRLNQPINLNQFFDIAIQCADALTAAHERGILHSDVKPENVMLTESGQVKLLDFGVARRLAGGGATNDGSDADDLGCRSRGRNSQLHGS